MTFGKLFLMHGSLKRGALHLDPVDDLDVDDVLALARGQKQITSPLRLAWHSGSRRGDWVDATFAALNLVSDAMIELFEENGFSGWSTYPVEITGRDGEPIEGYRGLAITGRCGPIDNSRSTEVTKMPISAQGRPYRARIGLFFDESTWDGSDLFMPDESAATVVTEPVKEAIDRAKLKNLSFERLTEVERMMISGT